VKIEWIVATVEHATLRHHAEGGTQRPLDSTGGHASVVVLFPFSTGWPLIELA